MLIVEVPTEAALGVIARRSVPSRCVARPAASLRETVAVTVSPVITEVGVPVTVIVEGVPPTTMV